MHQARSSELALKPGRNGRWIKDIPGSQKISTPFLHARNMLEK